MCSIEITITGELSGRKALIYELPGRRGRRRFVRTYRAFAKSSLAEEPFEFYVMRDSSRQVFGEPLSDPYGIDGECPPSGETPYRGVIRESEPVGFRVQLCEDEDETSEVLVGRGSVERKHIQIHHGAAASNGCIMVAGSRRSYRSVFERRLRLMLTDRSVIHVTVHPR